MFRSWLLFAFSNLLCESSMGKDWNWDWNCGAFFFSRTVSFVSEEEGRRDQDREWITFCRHDPTHNLWKIKLEIRKKTKVKGRGAQHYKLMYPTHHSDPVFLGTGRSIYPKSQNPKPIGSQFNSPQMTTWQHPSCVIRY